MRVVNAAPIAIAASRLLIRVIGISPCFAPALSPGCDKFRRALPRSPVGLAPCQLRARALAIPVFRHARAWPAHPAQERSAPFAGMAGTSPAMTMLFHARHLDHGDLQSPAPSRRRHR